ncbi:rhodanese-like domain-containing protein [Roseateles violae]|uniref:Rhodanese-like domain-containing protein n=1 Tax=Roseateles violae TaxID=3058042 RepID=A0ABT8DR38_9BURK|nr:rhodanese-like domain-containing protein [Pelomonas sp. PFR6]MDN3920801.1 rhodanese-like domain-containing protein [Pelomonas sp. PFR6]
MRTVRTVFAPLLAAGILLAAASAASAQSVPAAAKACNAGADPAVPGSTVAQIDGVTTVSPREAKCLLDKLGSQLVVIQAVSDEQQQLPNAQLVPDAARMSYDTERQKLVAAQYALLTGGDRQRPLLVYCHSASCGYSAHAARHAVAAGYQNIFWLREGNEGWRKAGYAFGFGPVDAKGFPVRYAEEVSRCDSMYLEADATEMVARRLAEHSGDVESWVRRSAAESAESSVRCLERLKARYALSQPVQADAARRQARADAEVLAALQKSRAAIEADPARFYLPQLNAVDLGRLAAGVPAARNVRTFRQICGPFNLPLPPVGDRDGLEDVKARYNAYVSCFNKNRTISSEGFSEMDYLLSVSRNTRGIERYTCSRWQGARCVPDASYRPIGNLTTAANYDFVLAATHKSDSFRREREEVEAEMGYYKQRLSARFDEHNRYVAERDAEAESASRGYGGSGYGAPSYQPPPTPIRRSSDTSARGMR